MRLKDRVAIITGAGSGIGLAMATRYAEEGAKVVGVDVVEAGLERLKAITGVTPVKGDVTSDADMRRAVETALGLGGVDIVCNNAGVMDRFLTVDELTDEVWERVLAINVGGPMRLSRAALPAMRKAGKGAIINTSSVAGLAGARAGAAYVTSKHALIGLTKNMAATYGPEGIRCNVICPGGVNTGISLGGDPSERGYAVLAKTMGTNIRMAEPAEIANVAVFLASDEASFMNGAIVVADGGWLSF